mmetsp:Transcript_2636/g.8847  ORF Transcript_2636/g.8847 Transcript_2636/m.8847 type:complete len:184 (+) Transcript_2636:3-554(+)
MIGVESGGWAVLGEVAAAIGRSRPDLGEFDAQGLGALLEETDEAGRFELCGGKIRKIGRDQRQPRPTRHGTPYATSTASVGTEGSLPPPPRYRRRSRSLSSASVRSIRRGRSPSRSPSPAAATLGVGQPQQPLGSTAKTPLPPPGEHWTKYQDRGKDWFYYEGPLGRWWCEAESNEVQPYEEE